MSAAGSPSEAALAFAFREGRTRLADLYQRAPLRVLLPDVPAGEVPQAAVVNTGGGLVAGDRFGISARVGEGARALVMAQAAEKVYRSATGALATVETALAVGPGGWLEWLPQETILFADCRLSRRLRLDVAGDGRAMAGEILVFGRLARGERTRTGFVRDAIEVRRDGRLAWADALHLDGDYGPVLDAGAGFAGAACAATFVYAGPDGGVLLDAAREALGGGDGVRTGATVVNGVLVARWLAGEPRRLRASFGGFWAAFRAEAGGLPARLPRLWEV
jgi:urease accessory protein